MINFRKTENIQFIEDVVEHMNKIDEKAIWEIAIIEQNKVRLCREDNEGLTPYEIELCNIDHCEFFAVRAEHGREITYALRNTSTLKDTMISLAQRCCETDGMRKENIPEGVRRWKRINQTRKKCSEQ